MQRIAREVNYRVLAGLCRFTITIAFELPSFSNDYAILFSEPENCARLFKNVLLMKIRERLKQKIKHITSCKSSSPEACQYAKETKNEFSAETNQEIFQIQCDRVRFFESRWKCDGTHRGSIFLL